MIQEGRKKIQVFEANCLKKLLRISYLQYKTNNCVCSKINFLVGPKEPLLATVKRWELAQFGHVTHRDNLSKNILQGTLECGRHRGRQRKHWMDNIEERTSLQMPELLKMAFCRKD